MSQNGADAHKPVRRLRVRPRLALAIAAAFILLAGALTAGLVVGYWGGARQAWPKIQSRVIDPTLRRMGLKREVWSDTQEIAWSPLATHLHRLEVARIQVTPHGAPAIWALAEAGDNLVLASRLGALSFLDTSNRFRPLDLKVDMGASALAEAGLLADPVFQISEVRTFDLLSVATGPDTYDLYASHNRFRNGCFEFVVSRARLRTTATGLEAVSPDWEDIYVGRPCIKLKDKGMRFAGHEGGGRLVMTGPDTLLYSVGIYQFDGITGDFAAGMDRDTDLGKVIEISISGRSGRIYAMGMRNPQGLLAASDGRIWETEHGPQGGDEVNLIQRGANYGWPNVSYGLDYGGAPSPPARGAHEGYTKPKFVFVPSIGISNLAEPDARAFPNWRNHLLASSLFATSLFALQTDGDAILYAERIPIDKRIRDIITLQDGRLALISEDAQLILIRNADQYSDAPKSFTVSGLTALPGPQPEESLHATQEVLGARVFHYYCGTCHATDGRTLAGPPLNGLFGRAIGSVEGYDYSSALSRARGVWSKERLRDFLEHRDPQLSGTIMPTVNLYDDQFAQLAAYLRTTQAGTDGVHAGPEGAR